MSDFPISVFNLKCSVASRLVAFSAAVYPILPDFKGDEMQETARLDQVARDSQTNYTRHSALFVRHWDSWASPKRSHIFVQSYAFGREGAIQLCGKPVDIMFGQDADSPVPPFGGKEDFDLTHTESGPEVVFAQRLHRPGMAWSTDTNIFTVPSPLILLVPRCSAQHVRHVRVACACVSGGHDSRQGSQGGGTACARVV